MAFVIEELRFMVLLLQHHLVESLRLRLRAYGGLRKRKRKREESSGEERHGTRESETHKKKKILKNSSILQQ